MTVFSKRSEAGIAHLTILIAAIVVIGVALSVFLLVRSSDSKDSESYTADSSSSFQVNHRNTARKNDVSKLLVAATEYINNNSGQLPTAYENGVLKGSNPDSNNLAPQFETLKYVTFAKGQQAAVTGLYDMRFVSQAVCGENGETITASSRSYVVQFALENVTGGTTPTCQEG